MPAKRKTPDPGANMVKRPSIVPLKHWSKMSTPQKRKVMNLAKSNPSAVKALVGISNRTRPESEAEKTSRARASANYQGRMKKKAAAKSKRQGTHGPR